MFTGHFEDLPEPLGQVVGDPLAFAETVGALVDYSLARRSDAGLILHRLVQAVIRQPRPARKPAPANWPRWRHLLAHVLTATAHHDDTNPTAIYATFWLLDRAATYQQTHGQPATARPLLERALHIVETNYGPDRPEVATTLNNLAGALRDLGEPDTARPLCERALHVSETAYGPDHPKFVRVRQTLRQLGDAPE